MAEELTVRQQKVLAIARARREREEATAKAESDAAANDAAFARREAWNKATPTQGAALLLREFLPKAKELVQEAGTIGVSTGVGQIAGQRVAGKVGKSVGGAAGAVVGEALVQAPEVVYGGEPIKFGRFASSALQGATSPRGAVGAASVNTAAEVVRSLIDEKRFPDLTGLSSAALTGWVASKAGQAVSGKELGYRDALMEHRDETFRKLRPHGFVVNPQELGRAGSFKPRLAGGPGAIGADAILMNQGPIQALARETLGLSKKQIPFRPDVINEVGAVVKKGEIAEAIERFEAPYKKVRSIADDARESLEKWQQGKSSTWKYANKSPDEIDAILKANDNLDALKKTRSDIKDTVNEMKANVPGARDKLASLRQLEDQIESKIDMAASASGNPKLLEELTTSRRKLAQAFAIRASVKEAYGLLDVQELAALRQSQGNLGGFRLTETVKDLADFGESFGRNAQDAVTAALPGGLPTPINFGLRSLPNRGIEGPAALGIPYISDVARKYLLSDFAQNSYAKPAYVMSRENLPSAAARNFLMTYGRDASNAARLPAEQP